MVTKGLWPKFTDHSEARCFNCDRSYGDYSYWLDTGNAPGKGRFKQYCDTCGHATYYDVSETAR